VSKIVERTLDFLELFAQQKRPLSLSDISRLLSLPVSSCHDVLAALLERGFIYEVSPRGGYYPTLRMYEAGRVIAENDPVTLRAEISLRELRDALDESVLLAKVTGLKGVYLLCLDSSQPLRFQQKVGNAVSSLHGASAGKTILASLDDVAFEAALDEIELLAFTPQTLSSRQAVRAQLAAARERGFFVNQGETIEGLTTISAPFWWQRSMFVVTVAGPASRLDGRVEELGRMVVEVCRKLEMKG